MARRSKWFPGLVLALCLSSAGCTIPPGPAPGNMWSGLCPTPEQAGQAQDCVCKHPLGQLLANAAKPVGAIAGLQPQCCPLFPNADLKLPADSAQGAAARIAADEAEAKARRLAVRYLGTVDCRYWPEARDGLINALRGDRNECVRWEAAIVLGGGCCCNKETLRALAIVVSGSEADGNPPEVSPRVREAAAVSLDRCLACVSAVAPPLLMPDPPKVEKPPETNPEKMPETGDKPDQLPEPKKLPDMDQTRSTDKKDGPALEVLKPATESKTTAYYHKLDKVPMEQVVHEARLAMRHHPVAARQAVAPPEKEGNSLLEIFTRSTAKPAAAGADVRRMVADLRQGSTLVRKEAVANLAKVSWTAHPEVVEVLIVAAKEDRDAGVRVASVRALGDLDVSTGPVVEALYSLESDPSPAVQKEASQVLQQIVKRIPGSKEPPLPRREGLLQR